MAEQKRPGPEARGTAPFVNDAADAPDQEAVGGANADRAIAAEEALRQRYVDAGTIPRARKDGAPRQPGEVKTQND